jgi:hypothetical protein
VGLLLRAHCMLALRLRRRPPPGSGWGHLQAPARPQQLPVPAVLIMMPQRLRWAVASREAARSSRPEHAATKHAARVLPV